MDSVVNILKFWHLIEHFTPYDLALDRLVRVSAEDLIAQRDDRLPWLNDEAFRALGGVMRESMRYQIFLLPFNKQELTRLSRQMFPTGPAWSAIEIDERLDDEGETCYAQLFVDSQGLVHWEGLSLSTLPWALGLLAAGHSDQINAHHYQAALKKFKLALNALRHRHQPKETSMEVLSTPFTTAVIQDLITLLLDWSKLTIDPEQACIYIKPIRIPSKVNRQSTACGTTQKPPPIPSCDHQTIQNSSSTSLPDTKTDQGAPSEDSDDEACPPIMEEIDILNSFYITDLEKVIACYERQEHSLLKNYLLGTTVDKIDLANPASSGYILEKLHPRYMNRGRWPDPPEHSMSLMQQLAIHESFYPTNPTPLFSVNGPPGTGKTTLLKDIVAENVVRRATVLAEFDKVADTFAGQKKIVFRGGSEETLRLLHPKLLGYEMLVVSSNNAAVENISKALPQQAAIAEGYRGMSDYLTPVANMIHAEFKNDQLQLAPEQQAWGLIAAALGNNRNRSQFINRVFRSPESSKQQAEVRAKQGQLQTIYQFVWLYQGPTFQQAKQQFKRTQQQLAQRMQQLEEIIELNAKLTSDEYPKALQEIETTKHAIQCSIDECLHHQQSLSQQLTALFSHRQQHRDELKELATLTPTLWQKLFNKASTQTYRQTKQKLKQTIITLTSEIIDLQRAQAQCKRSLKTLHQEYKKLDVRIQKIQDEKHQLLSRKEQLQTLFEDLVFPPIDHNLSQASTQKKAVWQSKTINDLRARLFIDALKLHQAWLVGAYKECGFKMNLFAISNLLSNNLPIHDEDAIHIWQSLFMWLPIVSSTFASVANQFKQVQRQQLGWLLIDEAGQAIPQAAIGAIWRTRQAVVIGDPLQIEPVFTTSPNLVEGLAKQTLPHYDPRWLPMVTSVQTLADQANCIGAYMNNQQQSQWVGCPLRVHRRCLEPMFSIANDIAYGGMMVQARIDETHETLFPLGESGWFHITGDASDKQYVTAQAQILMQLLARLYAQQRALPNVYIITPFKRVKENLRDILLEPTHWILDSSIRMTLPHRKALYRWCAQRLGTVHTFQGKEETTVIFVLGADPKTESAANWAASKPNLLNVALTRARDRIYFIGDLHLWGSKPFFNIPKHRLQIKNVVTH